MGSLWDSLTKQSIDSAILNIPQVWETYGIAETSFPIPIPGKLLKREVWRELPNELKGTEPLLSLSDGLVIPCKSATFASKQIREILDLEKSSVQRIVFFGIVTMSSRQGVDSGFSYKQATRGLKSLKVAAEKNGLGLYKGGFEYIDVYVAKHFLLLWVRVMSGVFSQARSSYSLLQGILAVLEFRSWTRQLTHLICTLVTVAVSESE
jgi:hypothetical protein